MASYCAVISAQNYRPDIDGLRAVAILLVVGCHVGVPGMAGGFTGVDIFFVISGYLITGLLVREQMEAGRIDIAAFYARRVRRLLPAFGVVIAVALLLGYAILLPDEQIALAQSVLASLALVANFYFWRVHQGYFADPSKLLPLQHLWTLAVEEQFYVLCPVALVLSAKLAERMRAPPVTVITTLLAAVSLLSFTLSIAVSSHFPVPAFLLLPTRAWELGVGGILAMTPVVPARLAKLLAPLALVAIGLATLTFSDATPFPSFYALLPVLGAVMVIASGSALPTGSVSRLLASRWFVALGKLSYSWYL